MPLTFAQAKSHVQLLVQDTDTTDPGLTSSQYDALLNNANRLFNDTFPDRVQGQLGTADVSSGNKRVVPTISGTTPRYFTKCERVADAGTFPGRPLDKLDVGRIRYLQEAVGTTGTPTMWAWERASGSSTTFWVYLYPIPDASFDLQLWGPLLPTNGSLTVLDGDDYTIAVLAAISAGILLRRAPDMMAELRAMLPPEIQRAERFRHLMMLPQDHPDKAPV